MSLLDTPMRINHEAHRIYIYPVGEVCIDLTSGTHEDRERVMALLSQTQTMAKLLLKHAAGYGGHNCHTQPQECSICGPVEECLRDAGVL